MCGSRLPTSAGPTDDKGAEGEQQTTRAEGVTDPIGELSQRRRAHRKECASLEHSPSEWPHHEPRTTERGEQSAHTEDDAAGGSTREAFNHNHQAS